MLRSHTFFGLAPPRSRRFVAIRRTLPRRQQAPLPTTASITPRRGSGTDFGFKPSRCLSLEDKLRRAKCHSTSSTASSCVSFSPPRAAVRNQLQRRRIGSWGLASAANADRGSQCRDGDRRIAHLARANNKLVAPAALER